jgi:ZIP family zinc transporter
MILAFAWGILAASSLLLGAMLALRFNIPLQGIGLIMAFGAGALISAVAFDLMEEAMSKSSGHGAVALGIFVGSGVFFGGNWLIGRSGGAARKDASGAQVSGSALAIVLGTALDGVPESMVLGLTLLEGGRIGIAYLIAVCISNLSEAISATSGLSASGWSPGRVLRLWLAVVCLSGIASLVGYVAFQHTSADAVAVVLAFAAGAILTMLADTMMPEAFDHGGNLVGVLTTAGFGLAFLLSVLV